MEIVKIIVSFNFSYQKTTDGRIGTNSKEYEAPENNSDEYLITEFLDVFMESVKTYHQFKLESADVRRVYNLSQD